MCGRYNLFTSAAEISKLLDTLFELDVQPRYNIAPTQQVPVIRQRDGRRQAEWMRWGLVPAWATDLNIGYRMINARAETLAQKNSFKAAFKRRRCLIPASGFYEWKKLDAKRKQPYHIGMADDTPFAFAGLWEAWRGGKDAPLPEPLITCTIITTDPNERLASIHDRMPVILPREHYELWLDPEFEAAAPLEELLAPYPAEEMKAHPVSLLVNNPRHDSPTCLQECDDSERV